MIYKKCIMTINKNNATLDEDIYLFRLDKNIELHFSIVNNRYKFDKSDLNNIIAQTNAAYFQIRLYRSDEIKYTFAIQPTQDGVAVLTITDDLINDPIELGEYDFQISLLDADKTSMISMPIVKQQLHVCEPLVDNQAIMGRAVLGLSSLASGEIKNAFDSEGNYIREIHNDGDILSAQLINKFEEALDTNTKAIKSQNSNLPHIISSKVLTTVPASDIKINDEITVNNISINKDRRYYIEFLNSKKLCSLLISEIYGDCIVCSIGNYFIEVHNNTFNISLYIEKLNADITTDAFTDLIIYEEEVKYIDNKYLEADLVLQNSISLGRVGDIGMGSSAIGEGVIASNECSHAEGKYTTASGNQSHAEGNNTQATSDCSHAEGDGTTASGTGSHAEGSGTTASGLYSHSEGNSTTASGDYGSHAEGSNTIASGVGSHAEGNDTTASGRYSHAEGASTIASGENSHAEGKYTEASGESSHVEGDNSHATGNFSHAEGGGTTASGENSHAEGASTIASSQNQHVQGKYNIEDTEGKYAHIVGNGEDGKNSNAHTLDWEGNAWFAGKLSQEGTPTENKDLATKKYVDDNILLEQLPILRIDETNKRIYVNCNNMGTYKKYFVPNKYANVYGFSFIYTNEDKSETEIALVGGAMTRDDFILCTRNTDTLFILILGGTNKYTYTKSTKTLEKGLYGYLKIGNTQEYTPTENYHPATKKYVDNMKTDIDSIKTELGTETLNTTAKDIKGAVNEVAAQYKDIAKNNKPSTNLFNSKHILLNKTIEAGGVETDNPLWFISTDYMEVEPNESYYFNVYDFNDYTTGYRVFMCFYDENKKYISKSDGIRGSQMDVFDEEQIIDGVRIRGKRYATPEGTKYARLQMRDVIVNCKEINFSKTSELTKTYTPYFGGYASQGYVDEKIDNTKKYVDEKIDNTKKYVDGKIDNIGTNPNMPVSDAHLLLNSFNNAEDILTCFMNSINFDNEATVYRNHIGQGNFSHDSTLVVDENGIGYICYVQNDVDLADNPGSVNAYTELAVLDLKNLSTSTTVERFHVAKHNDLIAGKTIDLGAGVPNCVVIGTKVYCIFSVKLEDIWYLCSRVFNTDTKTFEDAKLCKFTKDGTTYDFTTNNLSTIASSYTGNLDSMVSMNAQISYNETDQYYYCGVCTENKIKNSLIFRTKDFYTFEFWLEPNFDNECNCKFEGACLCDNGKLYYALRQDGNKKALWSNYIIIAKFDIATKNRVDEIIIPDAGSRACWFKDASNNIYLAHSMNKRLTIEFLKIDKNYLSDSRIILQGNLVSYVYPSIVKYGDYYYISSTGSSSTCVYVRRFTLNKFNTETMRDKFISVLNISN